MMPLGVLNKIQIHSLQVHCCGHCPKSLYCICFKSLNS